MGQKLCYILIVSRSCLFGGQFWYEGLAEFLNLFGVSEGSATQQNCVRDYVIFEDYTGITPGFYRDYIICNSINCWRIRKTRNYGG